MDLVYGIRIFVVCGIVISATLIIFGGVTYFYAKFKGNILSSKKGELLLIVGLVILFFIFVLYALINLKGNVFPSTDNPMIS